MIEAVYQDTMPDGSKIGTLIMLHGSPGSHNDFKYVARNLISSGIRLIGINYPGMGYSSYDERVFNNNEERTRYVQELIRQLGLNKNLVFMGHSRGSENALRLAAVNSQITVGMVIVNPIGFQKHKGVYPFWGIKLCAWLWVNIRSLRFLFLPLFHLLYKLLGFRAANGYIAANSLQQMAATDFEKQKNFVELLNKTPHLKALILFSGKDHLVEPERSLELISAFDDCEEICCITEAEKSSDEEENQLIHEVSKKLIDKRPKNLYIFFSNEDHFLQKRRAKLLSESIKVLLQAVNSNNSKI